IIRIHAEHETAIDHHAESMQASHGRAVIAIEVLHLPLLAQVADIRCFKSHKEAPEAAIDSLLEEAWLQHRIHGTRSLPKPAHTAHTVKEGRSKLRIPEQMIIEKVQMPPG